MKLEQRRVAVRMCRVEQRARQARQAVPQARFAHVVAGVLGRRRVQRQQHTAQAGIAPQHQVVDAAVLEALDRQALQWAQVVGHLRPAPEPVTGQVRKDRAVALESADTAVLVEHFGQAPAIGLCIRQRHRGASRARPRSSRGTGSARLARPTGRATSAPADARHRPAACHGARAGAAHGCRVWQGRRSRSGAAGGHRAGGCLRRPSAAARRAAPCRPAPVPAPGSSAGPGSARWRDGRGSTGWCAASARPRSRSTVPSTRAIAGAAPPRPGFAAAARWPGRWATSGVRAWLRRAARARPRQTCSPPSARSPGTRAAARHPDRACRARARARGTRRARRR